MSDRASARREIGRKEFLKRGGAALAGVAGAGALAGFSPITRSASAQIGWPGVRYYLDPILAPIERTWPPDPNGVMVGEFQGIEDRIFMRMDNPDEVSPPLQRNETLIQLRRTVGWSKQIELMLRGSPTGVTLRAALDSDPGEGTTMRLCTPDTPNPAPGALRADTIVFTKPKEWGTWYYMYHFDPDQFWYLFGGKLVQFRWVTDNDNRGYARVFRTGLEDPEFQPDWFIGTPERNRGVSNPICRSTAGSEFEVPPPAHIGSNSLVYAGYVYRHSRRYPSLCYFQVFDVNLYIDSATLLHYWIYPTTDLARYVGVDFVCTNGETLRDSGAVDWDGVSMHPAYSHRIRTNDGGYSDIPLNKWTPISCNVGRWLADRTIDRILVSFQLPRHRLVGVPGWFEGHIDTIYLGTVPPGTEVERLGPTSAPVGPIIPSRSS